MPVTRVQSLPYQARECAIMSVQTNRRGIAFAASPEWERRFLANNPEIGMRVTASMAENRAHTMTATVVTEHLQAYARICRQYGITEPLQVGNCDQTGV